MLIWGLPALCLFYCVDLLVVCFVVLLVVAFDELAVDCCLIGFCMVVDFGFVGCCLWVWYFVVDLYGLS